MQARMSKLLTVCMSRCCCCCRKERSPCCDETILSILLAFFHNEDALPLPAPLCFVLAMLWAFRRVRAAQACLSQLLKRVR